MGTRRQGNVESTSVQRHGVVEEKRRVKSKRDNIYGKYDIRNFSNLSKVSHVNEILS